MHFDLQDINRHARQCKTLGSECSFLDIPEFRNITEIRASLNRRKKKKAEPSQLIPWKLTANLELSNVVISLFSPIVYS